MSFSFLASDEDKLFNAILAQVYTSLLDGLFRRAGRFVQKKKLTFVEVPLGTSTLCLMRA